MTSLQLADFGADVVKVEHLPLGDPLRAWKQQGPSTFWKTYGRNKRSIGLNFRGAGAVDLLRDLMEQADVMLESFRAGTLAKMSLGPEVSFCKSPKGTRCNFRNEQFIEKIEAYSVQNLGVLN